ncbi:nuclear transport factor 2-like protein [Lutibacter citreus]|uniref:nuclear transport factor 2 family protein n=1 Tax=Lutibacter citreus TaxID=2138210 RepID=UPI000DBE491D|nr:nuclear transport factor 2 family protein [Lutibacter citreus]
MKKIILILLMIFTVISYAQKKKNGTVYKEHPAINVVEDMMKAFVEGDENKVASYLAEDFKSYNGSNGDKDAEGSTKDDFKNQVLFWKKNAAYLTIKRTKEAYPDAIEYKDSDNDDSVWVQTWVDVKAVHKKSGVKIDMPFHRLYVVNKDNKIKTMISYYDESIYDKIGASFVERTNGTIYNNHENINKVRILIQAYANDDYELAYTFYDKDARFSNIHMLPGKSKTLEESKENDLKFKEKYTIESIDVNGYPDYLKYELGNGSIVQSWWTVRLTRNKDKKKLVVPILFIHDFNDKGMITREMAYFSLKLME